MPKYVMLNNVEHRNLRVIAERSARYGDGVHYALTFPMEFRRVQSCYPIFFQKEPDSGRFVPIALFGFEEGENLFLADDGWDAKYVPMMIRRHPFLIGYQNAPDDAAGKRPVVSIDMDSPRVSDTEGEALFLEHGGTSDYLASMMELLDDIHAAHDMSARFVEALLEFDLLESVSMQIELKDNSKRQLLGLYTINEERLEQLGGEALGSLQQRGFLLPIYMILASLSSFRTLIDRRNDRMADEFEH